MRFFLGAQLLRYCLGFGLGYVVFVAQGFNLCGDSVPVTRQLFIGRNVTKLFDPFGFFSGELCAPKVGKLPNLTGARMQDSA